MYLHEVICIYPTKVGVVSVALAIISQLHRQSIRCTLLLNSQTSFLDTAPKPFA